MFLVYLFIFLLGLATGSFLNVVIYRLEKEESLSGRSYCPHCKHTLNWLDLVPLFSFFALGGKCRYCHEKISIQYPIVELLTGIIFLLIFWSLGFNWALGISLRDVLWAKGIWDFVKLCFMFYVSSSMIVIFVYDLKHYLIPDKVLFPAIGIAFAYRLLTFENSFNYILAAATASGFFLIIYLISRGRWMGFGDVKLAILLGLILGFPNILAGLFLAFLFGAIIGGGLILFKKKKLKSQIPFAPFLITGTFAAMFLGNNIISWYLSLFAF